MLNPNKVSFGEQTIKLETNATSKNSIVYTSYGIDKDQIFFQKLKTKK
jgi:hypothetical protein